MFIQVISGKVTDVDAMERLAERWDRSSGPGATGFLGVTQGITDDDRFVVLARFESKEAATKNSERPEQGEWFAEMEKVVERRHLPRLLARRDPVRRREGRREVRPGDAGPHQGPGQGRRDVRQVGRGREDARRRRGPT